MLPEILIVVQQRLRVNLLRKTTGDHHILFLFLSLLESACAVATTKLLALVLLVLLVHYSPIDELSSSWSTAVI